MAPCSSSRSLGAVLYAIELSPFYTRVNEAREQPVPFSHKHHAGELGIDCRYCHTSVEKSSFAGMPPTQTCMTCHSQIWTNAPMLEPVRASYRDDKSISWTRVNAAAGFRLLRSQHSREQRRRLHHLPRPGGGDAADVEGQYAVHGMVPRLPPQSGKVRAAEVRGIHPGYVTPSNQLELGRRLVKEYKIQSLTNCSTCHR